MTKLCVPLVSETCEQMACDIEKAARCGADMIELRVDYLRDLDADSVSELVTKAKQFEVEIIVTCRIADEGGQYKGDETKRIALLTAAA